MAEQAINRLRRPPVPVTIKFLDEKNDAGYCVADEAIKGHILRGNGTNFVDSSIDTYAERLLRRNQSLRLTVFKIIALVIGVTSLIFVASLAYNVYMALHKLAQLLLWVIGL